uniref:ATP synthase F0 subunit 8 n=1 Tax=Procambarus dupratzi TaxID=1937851 RepID=UPI0022FD747B|nr:ATP synthase F0 subunit 8 [Procambarus dupratzi]WBG72636.1 ATP synthase F0 subunit 8 [Procambarus dupratzi]
MPQMSPIFWMNLYVMFLLSLVLMLVVQYFLVIYCNSDIGNYKNPEIEKLWKW